MGNEVNEKTCQNCGRSLAADAKYCSYCGQEQVSPEKKKARKSRTDNFVIIGVIAITVLIYVVYQVGTSHSDRAEQAARPPVDSRAPVVNMESFVENLPEDFSGLVSMGNGLMDNGQYQLAVECYSRALEQKPEDAHVRVDMGACYHALGNNDRAIAAFKKALEYEPEHEIAKFNLGIVYSLMGQREKAADWWNKLLAQNPPPDLKQRTQELLQELEAEPSQ